MSRLTSLEHPVKTEKEQIISVKLPHLPLPILLPSFNATRSGRVVNPPLRFPNGGSTDYLHAAHITTDEASFTYWEPFTGLSRLLRTRLLPRKPFDWTSHNFVSTIDHHFIFICLYRKSNSRTIDWVVRVGNHLTNEALNIVSYIVWSRRFSWDEHRLKVLRIQSHVTDTINVTDQ